MAYPFGHAPRLRRVLQRLDELGCSWSIKPDANGDYIVVLAPNGNRLVIVDPDMEETVLPTTLENYERRLGVRTGYPSWPSTPDEAQQ